MHKLRVPVIVEGKYDKARLAQVVDAPILTTDGFGIFNQAEKAALIRRVGQHGVILLCDSDGGGTVIRSYLKRILPPEAVYDLYIPQVAGKEKRKRRGGKAGFLGVEGIDNGTLSALFDRLVKRHPALLAKTDPVENPALVGENPGVAAADPGDVVDNTVLSGSGQGMAGESGDFSTGSATARPITKTDLYVWGLTGGEHAAKRRDLLCSHLSLPAGMTPNALLAALNILYPRDEFLSLCEKLYGAEA